MKWCTNKNSHTVCWHIALSDWNVMVHTCSIEMMWNYFVYSILDIFPSSILQIVESLSRRRFCQHGRQPEVSRAVIDGEWWRQPFSFEINNASHSAFTFVISNENGWRHHSPSITTRFTSGWRPCWQKRRLLKLSNLAPVERHIEIIQRSDWFVKDFNIVSLGFHLGYAYAVLEWGRYEIIRFCYQTHSGLARPLLQGGGCLHVSSTFYRRIAFCWSIYRLFSINLPTERVLLVIFSWFYRRISQN